MMRKIKLIKLCIVLCTYRPAGKKNGVLSLAVDLIAVGHLQSSKVGNSFSLDYLGAHLLEMVLVWADTESTLVGNGFDLD